MAKAIKIPDIGTTVDEVTIVKLRKKPGDFIKIGEVIAEIETDKAVVELESIAEGKILEILCKEGETIKQGSVIAYVGKEGESLDNAEKPPSLKISPALKNLALKMGVDISNIKPLGPGGTITREDILGAAKGKSNTKEKAGFEKIPSYQKAVIRKVMKSHLEIPPVHFITSIEMDRVIDFRNKVLEERRIKIPYDVFFILSSARCIERFPVINSFISDEGIEKRQEISIGFAVGCEDKLFTPVIRSVDKKNLMDINSYVNNLVQKAHEGKILPEEMEGACFLISNLGMYPVEQFEAIIYPGHSGILAIGRISKRFVVEDNRPVIKNICNITLSVDHRIINGLTAGKFLKEVKEFLEKGQFEEEI